MFGLLRLEEVAGCVPGVPATVVGTVGYVVGKELHNLFKAHFQVLRHLNA